MGKTLEEMKKEPGFYWKCTFCGEWVEGKWVPTENVGNESTCKKCSGPRVTA